MGLALCLGQCSWRKASPSGWGSVGALDWRCGSRCAGESSVTQGAATPAGTSLLRCGERDTLGCQD